MAGIKIGIPAKAVLPDASLIDSSAQQVFDEAVKSAAGVDGDRYLDKVEAEAVRAAFDSVVGTATPGAKLDAANSGAFQSALQTRLSALKGERKATTDVAFTSAGDGLETMRAKLLGGIDETIERANGRKVDVNIMIFAFTDSVLADQLADRARNNPNVTIRLLTDWSQLPESGDRQPARLSKMNLPNLVVKFKKDSPYTWNAQTGRPDYNHGATQGLNHHKGFVTLIEGRPEKMSLGSFNWSVGAGNNYENLMVLDRKDSDNRPVMEAHEKEFRSFWNDDRVALSHREALVEKERQYKALHAANNAPYTERVITMPALVDPLYDVPNTHPGFDINSFKDEDVARLKALVGATKTEAIMKELRDFGRFDHVDELLERVPSLSTLSATKLEQLRANGEFGEGGLSVTRASVSELDRAGFSKRQAEKVVAYLQTYGAIENIDELKQAAGLTDARLRTIAPALSAEDVVATYSASIPGTPAMTGWSPDHQGNATIAKSVDANGVREVESVKRDMASVVVDMLRRTQPGETFKLAMYGISPTSPEFAEMVKAAERGVVIRAVFYKEYNESAIAGMKALKARGLDVDLRIISSKVMHEKFAVRGNDVMNGSANFSLSSMTKHTEDRFLFRNREDVAQKFSDEFDLLFSRGRVP